MIVNAGWMLLGFVLGLGTMYIFKDFIDDQLAKLRKKNK